MQRDHLQTHGKSRRRRKRLARPLSVLLMLICNFLPGVWRAAAEFGGAEALTGGTQYRILLYTNRIASQVVEACAGCRGFSGTSETECPSRLESCPTLKRGAQRSANEALAALPSNVTLHIPAFYEQEALRRSEGEWRQRAWGGAANCEDSGTVSLHSRPTQRRTCSEEVARLAASPYGGLKTSSAPVAGAALGAAFGGIPLLSEDYLFYTVRLTDDWVVVEDGVVPHEGTELRYNAARHPTHRDVSPRLLHCRLPQPVSIAEQARREEKLFRAAGYAPTQHTLSARNASFRMSNESASGGRLSAILWKWLQETARTVSPESGCFYGDGEAAFTGVRQWYALCPGKYVARLKNRHELRPRFTSRRYRPSSGSLRRRWRSSPRNSADSAVKVIIDDDFRHSTAAERIRYPLVEPSGAEWLMRYLWRSVAWVFSGWGSGEPSEEQLRLLLDGDGDGEAGRHDPTTDGADPDALRVHSTAQAAQPTRRHGRRRRGGGPSGPAAADSPSRKARQWSGRLDGSADDDESSSKFDPEKHLWDSKRVEIIGVFNERVTPNAQWSPIHRAWEFFFPSEASSGPDSVFAARDVGGGGHGLRNLTRIALAMQNRRDTRDAMDNATFDMYREDYRPHSPASTTVRLRCGSVSHEGRVWSVSQVRQTHRFVIEITSTAVCPWDVAMAAVRTAPILCISLG